MTQQAIRYRITAVERGIRYSAHYFLEDGLVKLESAYGSPSAPGGKEPKATAERLLLTAVREWRP